MSMCPENVLFVERKVGFADGSALRTQPEQPEQKDHADMSDHQPELGLDAAKLTEITTLCDDLITALQNKGDKATAYDQAVLHVKAVKAANLGRLRELIARWKTEDGYTDAIGADLDILGGTDTVNPDAVKPEVVALVTAGHVQLRFKKFGADAVNLYQRKSGAVAWKFLARDTNSPYDDHSPLTTPGVPEIWEYQARAVISDAEVGQPSDIVTVTFGG